MVGATARGLRKKVRPAPGHAPRDADGNLTPPRSPVPGTPDSVPERRAACARKSARCLGTLHEGLTAA
ncbi:hypothetical protein Scel_26460 [Streptomyces cellostaticus]|nr:hypothetical protein Scel_26460 [Streptomyces cellostaticus]